MTGNHQARAAVDNSAWDGPAAMSGCAKMDDPAAAYKAICAGRKDGDPALQSSWALPHHKSPGAPPNAAGVRNSLSRLPQTQGLTNKQAAQAHLEAHMTAIHGGENAATPAQARELRAAVAREQPGGFPLGAARSVAFPSAFTVRTVQRDGKEFYHFHGTATAYGQLYDMWDAFGPYREGVRAGAGAMSLAAKPDVAFLTNHRGVTMARTTNQTLELAELATGLDYDAYANAQRQDVQILASAVHDKLVTESSFAFMIDDGEWNDDFSEFWITRYDINRGDVSAVNYGANPYTSVAARSREILADLPRLPAGAQRAAMAQLQEALGACQCQLAEARAAVPAPEDPAAGAARRQVNDLRARYAKLGQPMPQLPGYAYQPTSGTGGETEPERTGRSVEYWETMLRL